jgi:hypothetical protein
MRRIVIALLFAGLLVGGGGWHPVAGQSARDEAPLAEEEEEGPAAMFGWGMASVGTSIVYMPAKLIYAIGGGLVGLMAWGVTAGNSDVAKSILVPAFGGTWVVTPEMLQGREPILFIGRSYEPER